MMVTAGRSSDMWMRTCDRHVQRHDVICNGKEDDGDRKRVWIRKNKHVLIRILYYKRKREREKNRAER